MSARDRFMLDGRRVLVTGAAGGIGAAVVGAAVELGASVVAVDREQPEIVGVETGAFDLRDVAQVERFVADQGPFDALIHVAAVLRRTPTIDDITLEDWDLQHEVNLRGTFFLTRAVAGRMPAGGSIVTFTSQGWWTGGYGGSVAYNSAKGGIVTLTRGLAREFAGRRIRVNAVAPGAVDTPMMSEGLSADARAAFVAQIPLGRMAEPVEVADVALFLASDAARYITGATLNVSGGQLIY